MPTVAPDPIEIIGVKTDHDDTKHYHEWFANIIVEKNAVKSTFFVNIFLGDFDPDPEKWAFDLNLVGTHVIFASPSHGANEEHSLVTGTIPLTGALGDKFPDKAAAGKLEPDFVIPYLQRNLHWRIQKNDGTPVERAELPSLKVSVGHSLVAPPSDIAEFPTWGEATKETAVTAGRPGGAGEDD